MLDGKWAKTAAESLSAVWKVIVMTTLPIINPKDGPEMRPLWIGAIIAWLFCAAVAAVIMGYSQPSGSSTGFSFLIFGVLSLIYILVSGGLLTALLVWFQRSGQPPAAAPTKPGAATIVFGFNLMATTLYAVVLLIDYAFRLTRFSADGKFHVFAIAAVIATAAIVWLRSEKNSRGANIVVLMLLALNSLAYLVYLVPMA
jgi:hypothetical protein